MSEQAGGMEPGFYWMWRPGGVLTVVRVYIDTDGNTVAIELGDNSVFYVNDLKQNYGFERINDPHEKQLRDIVAGKQHEVTIIIGIYYLNGDRICVKSNGTWEKMTAPTHRQRETA